MERAFANPNGDSELIRRKQTQHRRDSLLHRILGNIRNALGDIGGIKRLNPLEHIGDYGESAVEFQLPSGNKVIGNTAAINTGDKAADGGGGKTPPLNAEM